MKTPVLYIAQCNEYYKIGVTKDIQDRMLALQTGNPFPVSLVKTYEVPFKFERTLHRLLAKKNFRGEWFLLGADDLAAVMSVCQLYENQIKERLI